ncbi:hypothetical protein HX017_10410 [Myroides marinus]|uniref:toxin-antitoxin system YwqK family antitoxin n=1 Tax=Myroides marinus TaxID=703342 RepID=UPI0025755BB9|nr:hypothetical protein [Myroides marinus]MDM1348034.1 hypothetical protein [Myroides marinus]MDM1350717.1 hypothetical protein [Myroides marinus]MDM1354505.1 hypothetical protein [Myroides marinus]MDM1357924.1 hypothetical protein [Myroides marinus]MDM1365359.1 hypothetical protein [Myroides marinus]
MNKVILMIMCMMLTSITSTLYAQDDEPVYFELNGKPLSGKIQYHNAYNILSNEVLYEAGYKKGLYKTYYTNGILFSQVNYVQGKREGERKTFYQNGKNKGSFMYQNDVLEGISKAYDEDGTIEYEKVYQNGVLLTATDFDDYGNVKNIRRYTDGLIDVWEVYNKRGKLQEKTFYKMNEPYMIEYYKSNGKLDHNIIF